MRINPKDDLETQNYSGTLVYLYPSEEVDDFANQRLLVGDSRLTVRPRQSTNTSLGRSGKGNFWGAIYHNGILLSDVFEELARRKSSLLVTGSSWLPNFLRINIRSQNTTNISRTQLRELGSTWDKSIREKIICSLQTAHQEKLLASSPSKRARDLACLALVFNLRPEEVESILPGDFIPISFIEKGGAVDFVEWRDTKAKTLYGDVAVTYLGSMQSQFSSAPIFKHWIGDAFVPEPSFGGKGMTVFTARMAEYLLSKSHFVEALRFVSSPSKNGILAQTVLKPKGNSPTEADLSLILRKAIHAPSHISTLEIRLLKDEKAFRVLPRLHPFLNPFHDRFAFGWSHLNLNHPLTHTLVKIAATVQLGNPQDALPSDRFGELVDAFESLPTWSTSSEQEVSSHIGRLSILAAEINLLEPSQRLKVGKDDFVPGSFNTRYRGVSGQKVLGFGLPLPSTYSRA